MSTNVLHHYQDLIDIFNHCFLHEYNTCLLKGGSEPVYLPASNDMPQNSIFFAHGFFSSALHECAHWLIAGTERRTQTDYGYWYAPDGRTALQQQLFQQVEVKPQAMEWILTRACGYRFRLSIDNLNGDESDSSDFGLAVYQQVKSYSEQGLNPRAQHFRQALCQFYNTDPVFNIEQFDQRELSTFSAISVREAVEHNSIL